MTYDRNLTLATAYARAQARATWSETPAERIAAQLAMRWLERRIAGALQVLLQTRRLKVAEALPEAKILAGEMEAFQVRVTAAAHDTYGAWREGQHEDLVLAVALACWWAERNPPHEGVVGPPERPEDRARRLEGEENREALRRAFDSIRPNAAGEIGYDIMGNPFVRRDRDE